MTLETLTTITLLTELLVALRANEPKGFRALLEMGLEELGLADGDDSRSSAQSCGLDP